jgi:uncharacterized protein YggE
MSVRRTGFVAVLGVVALVVVLVLSSGVLPSQAQTAVPAPGGQTLARTITVVGRGEVKIKPNVANTTVGVEVTGGTVDAALEDAQARMAGILAALKQLGIADKDIQTSNFSINFERQVPEPRVAAAQATPDAVEPPAGFYRVSNMVQVTIRDLTKVGDVLDTAVKAGANNVWGLSFGLDETDSLEAQAREAAVKNAQARAETLATLTGVEVGEVVAVSEIIGSSQVPMYATAEMARGQGGGGTPVEPGEVSFSTQIQIVYAIK